MSERPGESDHALSAGAFVTGLLFADLAFTGLHRPPAPGTEVWSDQLVVGPGGIANFAVGLARLGTPVTLAAAFGDDAIGQTCWSALGDEGVDLSRSHRIAGWPTPVTVALAYAGDRALVTHGIPSPIAGDALVGTPPRCATAAVHLLPDEPAWLASAHRQGTLVFGDVGWDPTERWSGDLLAQLDRCHAFTPNATEAMRYTGTDEPETAAKQLAGLVPLVVVTCGADGAIALDSSTGEEARVRGVAARSIDPTGAGDVFSAALIHATLAGWPLDVRLAFANLAAALSTERPGGAASAPTIAALREWWQTNRAHVADHAPEHRGLDDVLTSRHPN